MEQTAVYVWTGLGAAIGTLVLTAALLWASKTTILQARTLWRVLRGYRDTLEAGVDEPTDPLIRELARLSKLPPTLWSALLTGFLRSLADGLDDVLGEPADSVPTGEYVQTPTQS